MTVGAREDVRIIRPAAILDERAAAQLLGSIAVMYDSPHRHEITIYKVTVTEHGLQQGWTVESLCDDALIWAGLTIATCPRAELNQPPAGDPFRRR
jgi:hypothetical protein